MIFVFTSAVFIILDFFLCKLMRKDAYKLGESLITLALYGTNVTLVMTGLDFSYFPGQLFVEPLINLHGILATAVPFVSQTFLYLFITFLLVDLGYYGIHRLHHEVGIFWMQHSVHHSTRRLNFLAAHRNPLRITTLSLPAVLLTLPPLLGYRQDVGLWILAWIQVHQTLVHSEWIPRLWSPIEFIFNTPHHHRVHHSENNQYQSGNYGGVLILFDRMFGTFLPHNDQTLSYGLKGEPVSTNPIIINYRGWLRLYQQVKGSNSLHHAMQVLFIPRSLVKPNKPVSENRPNSTAA